MRIILARHILPISAPPLTDGAILLDGERIVAVGPREAVLEQAPEGSDRQDLGAAIVLPGLVNAHTHLELSWLGADRPAGGEMVRWVSRLIEARASEKPQAVRAAAADQLARLRRRGTVALADTANGTACAPLLAASGMHGLGFHEVFRFAADAAETTLAEAERCLLAMRADPDCVAAGDRWTVALTPHAPHTSSPALLQALSRHAAEASAPLSIHVAESPDESALLRDGSGGFRELLERRGGWDVDWSAPGLSPLAYIDRLGLLGPRTLAVHCVQLEGPDHALLQSRGATVVTCPRSNLYLDVGTAPVPRLAAEGVPVALGTDSLASAPDLDLFGELAALLQIHAELSPAAGLRMATLNGATALGLGNRIGSIEAGKLAELIVVPCATGDDPLEIFREVPEIVHRIEPTPGGST